MSEIVWQGVIAGILFVLLAKTVDETIKLFYPDK